MCFSCEGTVSTSHFVKLFQTKTPRKVTRQPRKCLTGFGESLTSEEVLERAQKKIGNKRTRKRGKEKIKRKEERKRKKRKIKKQ